MKFALIGNIAVLDRQRADRRFHRAGSRDQMAHDALGRTHCECANESPNTACTAAHSLRSFISVDVPCALT